MVATKVYYPSGDPAEGLSRAQILRSIDDSLRRLNMDYVDLLQIHRWDYNTPIEETLEALNDVVKAGKARYIGASSMHASQFARALDLRGTARLGALCHHAGSLQPDLPGRRARDAAALLRGRRGGDPVEPAGARKVNPSVGETTARLVSDEVGKNLYDDTETSDALIAERLAGIADDIGATRAQVALTWLLSKRGVAAPIVGTSREEQLDELLSAVDLSLTPEQIAELETPYQQHPVVGFK